VVIGVDTNIAFRDILGVDTAVDTMVLMPFFHIVLYIVLILTINLHVNNWCCYVDSRITTYRDTMS